MKYKSKAGSGSCNRVADVIGSIMDSKSIRQGSSPWGRAKKSRDGCRQRCVMLAAPQVKRCPATLCCSLEKGTGLNKIK